MAILIREIGAALARAVNLKVRPICVYGSDRIPENGIRTASISPCIASAIYQLATGTIDGPIYAGNEADKFFFFAGVLAGLPGLDMTTLTLA